MGYYGVSQDYGFKCEVTGNLVDRELYGFSEVMPVMGYHRYGRKNLLMNLLRFKLVHLTGQCTSHDILHILVFHGFITTLITLSKPQSTSNRLQIDDLIGYKY